MEGDVNENLGQANQVEVILEILNQKKGGFFIEAGAHDGEYLSNTLYLEVSWPQNIYAITETLF